MKYIELNHQTRRIIRIEDTLPSNSAEAAHFIECPDDSVGIDWWIDEATDTLHEEKIWTLFELRPLRNEKLAGTDWMLGVDSPYKDDATFIANLKTYRQELRDLTSHSGEILDSTWPSMEGISSSIP